MSPRREGAETTWKSVLTSYRWPLAIVGVTVGLALVGFLVYRATLTEVRRSGGAAADRVERIARGFLTGDVTEVFLASIPEVGGAGAGRLELATAEVTETFGRSDERRILWDTLSLGTTVTEIKVPVTYRYHVRLDDPWKVVVEEGICDVTAPALRASQPPAIHTDRMEKRSEQSWLRFDAAEQLEALEREITPRLIARARDPRHLALVRDEARRTVAAFVRGWLLAEDQWRRDRLRAIRVVFADEPADPAGQGTTLRLADE